MSRFFNQFKSAFFNPNYGWKTTHFWGPVANWGLVGAAVYDATNKGPEVISLPMTYTMIGYSSIFMRFAWMVQPRNYLLFSCHLFNVLAQSYQLARGLKYQQETRERETQLAISEGKPAPVYEDVITPEKALAAFTAALAVAFASKHVRTRILSGSGPELLKKFASHPAGLFTVHGWAPIFKWALSITNIVEYDRPVEKISTMQQTALTATGFIWARYSLVIIPKNWSLFAVNFVLGITGAYHLSRKILHDIQNPKPVMAIQNN